MSSVVCCFQSPGGNSFARIPALEPYDHDVLGPDGVGYVWSLTGTYSTTYRETTKPLLDVVVVSFPYVFLDCGESVDGDIGDDDDESDDDIAAAVDVLKAHSMGCTEEVKWRRYYVQLQC